MTRDALASLLRRLTWPLLPLALGACAVGPDFKKPAAPVAESYTPRPIGIADSGQRFVAGLDIPGQWWTLFHSPGLDRLIRRALADNPTIEAAQASLRQARENLYAQEGSFFPDISATFEPTRNKEATRSLSFATSKPIAYYNLFTAELAVTYTPDLWGGTRRQVESLVAQADQQRYALEATYLNLTAGVVTAAITEASLRAQIAATDKIIRASTELLNIATKQLKAGQIAGIDQLAQAAALAQARAQLPPLRKQLDQQRDLLKQLVGMRPDEALDETFDLDGIALPRDLPISLPGQLIRQRPDVLQAEATLHSATALVGVAIANRLPSLTLSAEGGSQSLYFNQLFASGNGFWTIAATLTQPIFQGGTLLHKARAAWAALDQSEANYKSTLLSAFQNVADSLHALQADADALAAAANARNAALATVQIVHLQIEQGQVGYLGILSAQQTALQAELALAQARSARLADTATLFQALGGGWWNRRDSGVPDIYGNDVTSIVGLKDRPYVAHD